MPFFAGHHRTTGAGLRGLILTSAPGVCAWATPFCPFLAKTGGSRWDRVAIFFFFQFDHTDDLYGFQCWRLIYYLVVQRAQHAAPPVGESFSPGNTKSSACSPTCRGIFSPCSTKSSACSPTCRGIFLSWYYRAQLPAPPKRQYVAPYSRMHRRFSPSNAAALTRH